MTTTPWAVLQYDDEGAIQSLLDVWFFTSSPAEVARGDMACMGDAAYRECVRWVRVPDNDAEIALDVHELHPTRDFFMVFYRLCEAFREIHVLGALPYVVVRNVLRGLVHVDADLTARARSRAISAPLYVERVDESSVLALDEAAWLFHFPHHVLDAVQSTQLRVEWMCHYATPDSFTVYRTFLAASSHAATIRPPYLGQYASTLERASREAACSLLCALLGEYLEFYLVGKFAQGREAEARRQRVRYDEKRMDTERMLLEWRMRTYCSGSQYTLLRLIRFNHMLMDQTHFTAVPGTARDAQAFWEMYPTAAYEPAIFFNVDVDHVDAAMVAYMPKYPTGGGVKVHLPCYWEPVCSWLWNVHVAASQRRFMLYRKADHDAAIVSNALLQDWLHYQYCNMTKTKLRPNGSVVTVISYTASGRPVTYGPSSNTVNLKKKPRGVTRKAPHDGGTRMADIEDTGSVLAPCLVESMIRVHGRPKNNVRLRSTQAMYGGDMHIASIEALFDDYFKRYPDEKQKGGGFSVRAAIEAVHDGTYCGNLVTNVMDQVPATLHCPYVKDVAITPNMDRKEITKACRGMCGVRGSGPHDWTRARLLERGAEVVAVETPASNISQERAFNAYDDEEEDQEDDAEEDDEDDGKY
jgi:hypothetical protein